MILAVASIVFGIVGVGLTAGSGVIAALAGAMITANLAVAGIALWIGRSALRIDARPATGKMPPGVIWC